MGKILIIRHGNRLDFLDPCWQNRTNLPTKDSKNSPLSECGLEQAKEVAAFISTNYQKNNFKVCLIVCSILTFQHVFSSPYLRTLQTAQPTSEYLGLPICVEYSAAEGV
jgi:broad specificity phosphatase PhoE